MGLYFEDFEVGRELRTKSRTVTEADVVSFAGLSGDYNPLHTDAEYMKNSPFGERIAHGMLVASIGTGLNSQAGWFEGTTVALMEVTYRFKAPVKFGDTVTLVLIVREMKPTSKPDRGVITMDANVVNQRDEVVIAGTWTTMMKRKES
ncbi:MAG: MaoC family dehydratase N-terminal domain-containing protein [Chloroflexi bacterium]|nr:MaoC family dehydratase N-terminal domain-containing protein [Chloroflexota bacterium]